MLLFSLPVSEAASAENFEKMLLDLHNKEREKKNKPRLKFHGALKRSARSHAADMETNSYFDHTGLDGSTADDRIRAQGYSGSTTGENIAFGYTKAKSVFKGWMKSPSHRRNIRKKAFRRVGFGKSGTYWVANFGS